ncbi:MAG: AbgT family transporter [Parvularculaceae bacterium]|nr:AbgT family transporter [Parvularculaceae bacterium]
MPAIFGLAPERRRDAAEREIILQVEKKPADAAPSKGVLGWIERTGNKLPDPAFLFLYLIGGLVVVSVVADLLGYSAPHPTEKGEDGAPVIINATSLFSADNIRRLWVDMPTTFTHFHPLGYVLVVMLGAGVAERTGLFAAAMRSAVRGAPKFLLTPMVALVAMMGNLAADAAYVVLIPLSAVLYAAAGRHPIAGITAAFAGVSGGFSANLLPGQLDALLFGITEAAAELIVPGWNANIAGNWYFIAAMLVVFLPVIWFVTDRIIEPKLGKFIPESDAAKQAAAGDTPLSAGEKKGLAYAGIALVAVVILWAFFTLGPGTPLIDETAVGPGQLTPFFRSLVAGFFVLFLAAGWAYGAAAGSIKGHRDVVRMMTASMADLGYYLILAFFAAHFVAMFGWSNLGLIFAVQGAHAIETSGLPMPALLALLVILTAGVNLFIGSASAKWALLAPVMVPMLMLLGVSPEATTAAYRVGDGATNIITPLMVYFPLILTFCQRWKADFGIGSLAAAMLPYSIWILISGLILTFVWIALGLPLGPGAPVRYEMPAAG